MTEKAVTKPIEDLVFADVVPLEVFDRLSDAQKQSLRVVWQQFTKERETRNHAHATAAMWINTCQEATTRLAEYAEIIQSLTAIFMKDKK